MSQATELLNSIPPAYTTTSKNEPHIVIDNNRVVTVPEELKRIAVQYDHRIETVTFDCPRYWDEHDMSKMHVYVNYLRSDGEKGSDLCTNVAVDKDDETMMHFDWTVTGHLSAVNGSIAFLVCTMKSSPDGEISERHWNSELNTEMYVTEGLEVAAHVYATQPGIIDALLTRMEAAEERTSEEAVMNAVNNNIDRNPERMKWLVEQYLLKDNNGQEHVDTYMKNYGQNHTNAYFDSNDNIMDHIDRYIYERDYEVTKTVFVSDATHKYIEWYDKYELGHDMSSDLTYSGQFYAESYICEVKAGDVIEISNSIMDEVVEQKPRYILTDNNHIICNFIFTDHYQINNTVRHTVEQDGYFYFSMIEVDKTNDTPLFCIKNKKDVDTINIDKTLAFTDMAADAKVVGDRFAKVDSDISEIRTDILSIVDELLYENVSVVRISDVRTGVKWDLSDYPYLIGYQINPNGVTPHEADGYFVYQGYVKAGDLLLVDVNMKEPTEIDDTLVVVDNDDYVIDAISVMKLFGTKKYRFTNDGYFLLSTRYTTLSDVPVCSIATPFKFINGTDKTLAVDGAAADAKAVGDKFDVIDDKLKLNDMLTDTVKTSYYYTDMFIPHSGTLDAKYFSVGDRISVNNFTEYGDIGDVCDLREVKKDYIIDISKNGSLMDYIDTESKFGILVADMSDIITEKLLLSDIVANDGKVHIKEDSRVYMGLTLGDNGFIYELYPHNRVVELEEKIKKSSTPYFINMNKIDTTDPAVGDAVINAFFAGRTLIVTDSTQDPGVDQRGYRFVQWVGLPRNGWNMVELRLSDGSSINLTAATRTSDNPYEEYENN